MKVPKIKAGSLRAIAIGAGVALALVLVVVASVIPQEPRVILTRAELNQELGSIVFQLNQRQAEFGSVNEQLQRGARGRLDSAAVTNNLLQQQNQLFAILNGLEGQRVFVLRLLER